jgi:hypothetical protein
METQPEHIIYANGTQEWWVNGKWHRLDGPAIIWADGTQEWWVNDKNITDKVEKWLKNQEITYQFDEETRVQFMLTF